MPRATTRLDHGGEALIRHRTALKWPSTRIAPLCLPWAQGMTTHTMPLQGQMLPTHLHGVSSLAPPNTLGGGNNSGAPGAGHHQPVYTSRTPPAVAQRWTEEQSTRLKELVAESGPKDWTNIAKKVWRWLYAPGVCDGPNSQVLLLYPISYMIYCTKNGSLPFVTRHVCSEHFRIVSVPAVQERQALYICLVCAFSVAPGRGGNKTWKSTTLAYTVRC